MSTKLLLMNKSHLLLCCKFFLTLKFSDFLFTEQSYRYVSILCQKYGNEARFNLSTRFVTPCGITLNSVINTVSFKYRKQI